MVGGGLSAAGRLGVSIVVMPSSSMRSDLPTAVAQRGLDVTLSRHAL